MTGAPARHWRVLACAITSVFAASAIAASAFAGGALAAVSARAIALETLP